MRTADIHRSAHLTRQVRLPIRIAHDRLQLDSGPPVNTWSGSRGSPLVAPYLSIAASIGGPIDSITGYVWHVKRLDSVLREASADALHDQLVDQPIPELLQRVHALLVPKIPSPCRLVRLTFQTSPYISYALRSENPEMIFVTQQFEFSAAHRLHSPSLSDEENRQVFGKCNHPSGHGHNYLLEVTIGCEMSLMNEADKWQDWESVVMEKVIRRFDHKHLDRDCPEFTQTVSTVENIAQIAWQLLVDAFTEPLTLRNVRVYETAKTWADASVDSVV